MYSLDDSSSLSSDPGMISSTDASGTTTTSSMSSTGDPIVHFLKPNSKCISSKLSKVKSSVKKTDSSMQTESVSALNSASVWKKYLHEHHLMMKANTVAPKTVRSNDESSKSLDRLDHRIPNGNQTKKPQNHNKVERHDSCDSLKHGINKNANLKLDLLSNKRPLSSPISSRVASATYSNLAKQHSGQKHIKCKTVMTTQTDAIHSDTEYVQHKQNQQQQNNLYNLTNTKYSLHLSPLRQRDATARSSSYAPLAATDCQSVLNTNTISPWLQKHSLTIQRDAITEAESMESLTGPVLDGANYFLSRHHNSTTSRPNSATIRFRESASASPAPNISSHNRSKEHSSQLIRSGSVRVNKCADLTTTPPTQFVSPIRDSNLLAITTMQQQHNAPSINAEDQINGSSLSLVSSSSLFSTVSVYTIFAVCVLILFV
jgi:hypothetical protein